MNDNTIANTKLLDCKTCRSCLQDLLLEADYALQHPEVKAHLRGCAACGEEFRSLEATLALMDAWTAPEPSPFFDSRLQARLREAVEAQPAGVWERMSSWWKFSNNYALRPAMAGALALVLLVGGGSFATFHNTMVAPPAVSGESATVNDLKIMDNNAQAIQQMDQLLDDNSQGDDAVADGPTT